MKHEMLEVDLTNLSNWAFNMNEWFDSTFTWINKYHRMSGLQQQK